MFKRILQVLMTGLLLVTPVAIATSATQQGVQAATATSAPQVDASAAIAIDPQSGQVLYEKNADQVLPIASMTKMITAYIVLDQIKQGKLKWNQTTKPDAAIYKLSQDKELTNVPLQADKAYSVRELYQAMLIASANDAAMMLANLVAGSQKNFVDLMRQQVSQWGIKDAKLYSVSGLNNQYLTGETYPGSAADAENEMSASEVAIVAQHLLKTFPEVLETTKQTAFTFGPKTIDETKMATWNLMLPGQNNAPKDYVVDGLKTGTTDKAGDCFTGTATKDGQRILTVVMHANGSDKGRRFIETNKVMQYVFDNWQQTQLVKKGATIKPFATADVKYGRTKTVALETPQAIAMWVPKGTQVANIDWEYQVVQGGQKRQLTAPVKKAAVIGKVTPKIAGVTNRYLGTTPQYTVQTKTADPKANVFVLIGTGVREFFTNLF